MKLKLSDLLFWGEFTQCTYISQKGYDGAKFPKDFYRDERPVFEMITLWLLMCKNQ